MSNLSISGMSLRDYFAAQAMQGLTTSHWASEKELAKTAYEIADALIYEKERTEKK